MLHMQDKEFDEMFKNLFDGAAIEPSEGLWTEIAGKLDKPAHQKKGIYLWVSVAAAAVILMVCGLILPRDEKIRLQSVVASVNTENATGPIVGKIDVRQPQEAELPARSVPLVIAPGLSDEEKKGFAGKLPADTTDVPDKHKIAMEPVVLTDQSAIPAVQFQTHEERPVIASAQINNADTTGDMYGQQERKGIRNVGDLVNFVVGKVDKRENKIVEFDTDDDNSSLVSLNLGIVRFNRKTK